MEVKHLRIQAAKIRVRLDLGLALAVYRYASEHQMTISDVVRFALIMWTSRAGYLTAAQTTYHADATAAHDELMSYYRNPRDPRDPRT